MQSLLSSDTNLFGFSVSTNVTFDDGNNLPSEIASKLEDVERSAKMELGSPSAPLILAVAPVSSTPASPFSIIYNVGLNDEIVASELASGSSPSLTYDRYRRCIKSFATTVLGIPDQDFGNISRGFNSDISVIEMKSVVDKYLQLILDSGTSFPQNCHEQLCMVI
ncbi:hypothetical protein GEMRC1_004740 [Eukaryota sp. GEM-RC1]